MPGERPSYIPPENPFSSAEGKPPPEPTKQFVERFLGKSVETAAGETPVAEQTDLTAAEDPAAILEAESLALQELMRREEAKLSGFFGRHIEVPSLPSVISLERILEWRELGMELHYLPPTEVTGREPGFDRWNRYPLKFYRIESDRVVPFGKRQLKVTQLEGGWYLIDGRPKPDTQKERKPQYVDDNILEQVPALNGSRIGHSWDQLRRNKEVVSQIAAALRVDPNQWRLPRAIEFNLIGSVYHPEWGKGETEEWLEDNYQDDGRSLLGGDQREGGLSHVGYSVSSNNLPRTGFRPLVFWPDKR